MNRLAFVILLLFSLESFGQQWSEYQIDSVLTLTFPDDHRVVDTLGTRVIVANIENAIVMVSLLPNTGKVAVNIRDEKDLIDSYKGFRKGYMNMHKSELIGDEVIDRNGLKAYRFSCNATMNGERQIRHCLNFFVNEKTYSIQFWELAEATEDLTETREGLFSSIKISPGLTLKNQLSSAGGESKSVAYLLGQITAYVLFFGAAGYGLFRLTRKKRS